MVITNIYILRYFNKHEQVYYYDIIACTFRLYKKKYCPLPDNIWRFAYLTSLGNYFIFHKHKDYHFLPLRAWQTRNRARSVASSSQPPVWCMMNWYSHFVAHKSQHYLVGQIPFESFFKFTIKSVSHHHNYTRRVSFGMCARVQLHRDASCARGAYDSLAPEPKNKTRYYYRAAFWVKVYIVHSDSATKFTQRTLYSYTSTATSPHSPPNTSRSTTRHGFLNFA